MLIGYSRVSVHKHWLTLQEAALKAAGCKKVDTDMTGRSKAKRPGLEKNLGRVAHVDSLIIGMTPSFNISTHTPAIWRVGLYSLYM